MAESFMEQRRQSGGDDSHADDRRLAVRVGHNFHSISRTDIVRCPWARPRSNIGRTLDGLLEVKQKSSLAPPNSSGVFPGRRLFHSAPITRGHKRRAQSARVFLERSTTSSIMRSSKGFPPLQKISRRVPKYAGGMINGIFDHLASWARYASLYSAIESRSEQSDSS
jgi:hypothetical protein